MAPRSRSSVFISAVASCVFVALIVDAVTESDQSSNRSLAQQMWWKSRSHWAKRHQAFLQFWEAGKPEGLLQPEHLKDARKAAFAQFKALGEKRTEERAKQRAKERASRHQKIMQHVATKKLNQAHALTNGVTGNVTGATSSDCPDGEAAITIKMVTQSWGGECGLTIDGTAIFTDGEVASHTTTDFGPFCFSPTTTYSAVLTDSYGDGWNGAYAEVISPTGEVLDTLTMSSGSVKTVSLGPPPPPPPPVTCSADEEKITIKMVAESWGEECGLTIDGTAIFTSGEVASHTTTDFGPFCYTPGATHTAVLTDTYGDGWNGAYAEVISSTGKVLDTLTMSYGSSKTVTLGPGGAEPSPSPAATSTAMNAFDKPRPKESTSRFRLAGIRKERKTMDRVAHAPSRVRKSSLRLAHQAMPDKPNKAAATINKPRPSQSTSTFKQVGIRQPRATKRVARDPSRTRKTAFQQVASMSTSCPDGEAAITIKMVTQSWGGECGLTIDGTAIFTDGEVASHTTTDFGPFCFSPTTTYSAVLTDSYGDGWNGAYAEVISPTGEVLDTLTMSSGSVKTVSLGPPPPPPPPVTCSADEEKITIKMVAESWGEECGLTIDGTAIFTSGEVASHTTTDFGPFCYTPGATHTAVLTDTYGDGWNGAYAEVISSTGKVLDTLTMSYGSSKTVTLGPGGAEPSPSPAATATAMTATRLAAPKLACTGRATFNAKYGGCNTYAFGRVNRNFCSVDGANSACAECGICTGNIHDQASTSSRKDTRRAIERVGMHDKSDTLALFNK